MTRLVKILLVLLIITSTTYSKELKQFLPQKTALHYYNKGSVLKCYDNGKSSIVTNTTHQAIYIGNKIVFISPQTGSVMQMASKCILAK